MHTVKIYTDGGARGNPGPAGSAFVVIGDGRIIHKEAKFLGTSTNNFAEYNGILMASNWLSKKMSLNPETKISFFMDSELVIRQLKGIYRVKEKKLKKLFLKVDFLINSLSTKKINYVFVKREKNKIADKLVNEVIDENT